MASQLLTELIEDKYRQESCLILRTLLTLYYPCHTYLTIAPFFQSLTSFILRSPFTHLNISQYPSTSFDNYREPHVTSIDDMDGVEDEQGQVQPPVVINNQDPLMDLRAMRDEVMTMY